MVVFEILFGVLLEGIEDLHAVVAGEGGGLLVTSSAPEEPSCIHFRI